MSYTKRNCNHCKTVYLADNRNLNRGWGLCCSKSCAAKLREKNNTPSGKQLRERKRWAKGRKSLCRDGKYREVIVVKAPEPGINWDEVYDTGDAEGLGQS